MGVEEGWRRRRIRGGGEMKDGERKEEDEASKRGYGMKRWSEKER